LTRERYPAGNDSEPPQTLALDESFALPPKVLLEQHSAELREAGRAAARRPDLQSGNEPRPTFA